MEIVSAIVGPVMNALTVHITQKLRNLTSSAERVRDMGKKMEDLEGQGADIERHVEDNKANNRETPKAAEVWLKKYKKMKEDRVVGSSPSHYLFSTGSSFFYTATQFTEAQTKNIGTNVAVFAGGEWWKVVGVVVSGVEELETGESGVTGVAGKLG
nr:NB-ARC domains-containing protein [Tanacetum cinerariifolium]